MRKVYGQITQASKEQIKQIENATLQALKASNFWMAPKYLPAVLGPAKAWVLTYMIDQRLLWLDHGVSCFPCKTEDIAKYTGLSVRTVIDKVAELEEEGFIALTNVGMPQRRHVHVFAHRFVEAVTEFKNACKAERELSKRDIEEVQSLEINSADVALQIGENCTMQAQKVHDINQEQLYQEQLYQDKGTVTSYRDEGQNPPSSGHSYSANHLAVNQALNATRSNTNTPANSKQRKPRRPPAPLPAHPAIPFMQELARTLAPVLATSSHADYPSEGATAFKYHTDALEAYDAIQTGAIMARTIDRPERYTDPTIWGNDFRMVQLKQWAKDPKAMEAALLSAARIFATSRAKNTTVAKLPTVVAFLFGSTTSGGFLPWWSAIKPIESMEAKEKQILKEAELEESSKPRLLELEEKNRIAQGSYYHEMFIKLFGREPKQFKETK